MGKGYSMKAGAAANEADIYIYEDVGESWFGGVSAKQFTQDLKALGKVDIINLHLNSYGGEVFDGISIYRALVDHKAKVISYIDGIAASIASVIAMAGDEIRISEAGFMMIHEASGGVFGRAQEHRQIADLLETITRTIGDVYVARTGQTKEAIMDWMAEEKWFTAAEAVELLFADAVVANLRLAAHATGPFDLDRHGFRHAPQQLKPANVVVADPLALPAPPKRAAPVASASLPACEPVVTPRINAIDARLELARAQAKARTLSAVQSA
jgi:ATP-dependent Clp protease protease subunit